MDLVYHPGVRGRNLLEDFPIHGNCSAFRNQPTANLIFGSGTTIPLKAFCSAVMARKETLHRGKSSFHGSPEIRRSD
jgi:hypothetical protein